ncbi:MAG: MmgE/PrpD family protein [Gammaproteobacteria bacterium]|nr:MmgE/PrpD family protein [Gammaproteobacteria bacterium]
MVLLSGGVVIGSWYRLSRGRRRARAGRSVARRTQQRHLKPVAEDLLERLAELAAETGFDDLPPAAVAATETFLLDALAVGVAGRTGPWREETLRAALAWGDGGTARILGDGLRAPPTTAAFVNAFQMHCLEFDCVHEGAVAHAMTAVAAAALAQADAVPVSGARLLLSLALGVEVAVALGVAARAPLRFFRPATVGVFGAAVAVGVLRGFDVEAIRRCFGHALGLAAGTMQAHEEGKPTLPLQLGAAARAGIVAAELAGAGVPAPHQALEGRHGYLPLFETAFDTAEVARHAGITWRVTELSHKPYPSGRATHGGIDAVLRLRAAGVAPNNLAGLTLEAPPLIHQLVLRPARPGMDASYARLCFAYTGALALACGRVGIEHFAATELGRADRLELAGRFKATLSRVADPAAFTPQTLTAELHNGSSKTVRIDALPGSPARPLLPAEQEEKVSACIAAAYPPQPRTSLLIEAARRLPSLADARAVLDPVTGAS